MAVDRSTRRFGSGLVKGGEKVRMHDVDEARNHSFNVENGSNEVTVSVLTRHIHKIKAEPKAKLITGNERIKDRCRWHWFANSLQ